jgi:hypothetical protein
MRCAPAPLRRQRPAWMILHRRFPDPGKLSSIIPRKAASIMWAESAADTGF